MSSGHTHTLTPAHRVRGWWLLAPFAAEVSDPTAGRRSLATVRPQDQRRHLGDFLGGQGDSARSGPAAYPSTSPGKIRRGAIPGAKSGQLCWFGWLV
jgi:hypothetical protein